MNTNRASHKFYALARQRIAYYGHRNSNSCLSATLHTLPIGRGRNNRDEDTQQKQNNSRVLYQNNITTTTIRQYHITNINERSGLAVVMGLGAIAATAKAGQYAVQGYKEWKEARELEEKEMEKLRKENPEMDEENVNKSSDQQQDGKSTDKESSGASEQQTNEKRENIFAKFFDMSVGSKYYEGGFEEKMTRKEAALILGVRESSASKRIKEAHRKLLILNHPDTGGSTFLSGKLNEAKELLLKGKK